MKQITTLLFLLFFARTLAGQEFSASNLPSYLFLTDSSASILSKTDSVWFSQLLRLKTDTYKATEDLPDLPAQLDNSHLPYFRPIFSQEQWPSCGQAAGVAYNFTYEINRARNLPADVPENQFPTHYVWNFSNGGYGWSGSSYFHSFEILRTNGSPTIADYGGMDDGGGRRWMSGYDKYYNGMHHRIKGFYSIEVGTPEGLLTLKHWLHNHLKGEETGGVASFYANAPWVQDILPPGTPEAGKYVIKRWNGPPTHAMTIIGYNDSIRWDYNGDGLYTNHLDINGDGVVDMRDWEIGGLIFANSYGDTWCNEGYAYMMYKTLADHVLDGGIWNYEVHVVDVIPDYSPLLTAKITLKHTARERIKVRVGVSENPVADFPSHIIDFPIFDFHGGDLYMQGGTEEEHKTIEFGLDITPLLSFSDNGQTGKYFLQVIEHDPDHLHEGEVISFSIIDYTGAEPNEHVYPDHNIPLVNNGVTNLGITAAINLDPVNILTEELPASTSGQTQVQMEVEGGLPPYHWSLIQEYHEHAAGFEQDLKSSRGNGFFPGWNQWVTTNIGFAFPFYDSVYEQITVYPAGFIMFGGEPFPYPYWLFPKVMLANFKCIAPFIAYDLRLNKAGNDTIWFEHGEDYIRITWEVTFMQGGYSLPHSFSASLYEDGSIEFHYTAFSFHRHCTWMAGISRGDGSNYKISDISGTQALETGKSIGFMPALFPENVHISSDGLLSYENSNPEIISEITVRATDSRWISNTKTFQLTDALILEFAPLKNPLIPGEATFLDVTIRNISSNAINGLSICFESEEDGFVNWIQNCIDAGNLEPDQGKNFSSEVYFNLGSQTPDNYLVKISGSLSWEDQLRKKTSFFHVKKSKLDVSRILLNGHAGNIIEAGESYALIAEVSNLGNIAEKNILVQLGSEDPYIIIQPPFSATIDSLKNFATGEVGFQIDVHPSAPPGYKALVSLTVSAENIPSFLHKIALIVSGPQIMIADLDPSNSSALSIIHAIEKLGFATRTINALTTLPDGHPLLMICLGTYPNRYSLTQADSDKLSNFLMNGGMIYMEGGATWRTDPRRPVHDLFMIEGKPQGWAFGIDSLAGNPGTLAEGFNFNYKGPNLRMDNMLPMSSDASILFTDVPTGYHYAIAFENEVYKTIGSTFKFMGLFQHESDTLPDLLMKEYLNYFGFNAETLVANFSSDAQVICNGGTVAFALKGKGAIQSVEWEFMGGTPESSTEFSPEILYQTPGSWPVKLIVHDATTSDTLLIENYITVELCTGIAVHKKTFINLYPNPASKRVIIMGVLQEPQDVTISLYNINGETIFSRHFSDFSNSNPVDLDISAFRPGLYLIRLAGREEILTRKLLIMN